MIQRPHSDLAPGELCPLCTPLVTPLHKAHTIVLYQCQKVHGQKRKLNECPQITDCWQPYLQQT